MEFLMSVTNQFSHVVHYWNNLPDTFRNNVIAFGLPFLYPIINTVTDIACRQLDEKVSNIVCLAPETFNRDFPIGGLLTYTNMIIVNVLKSTFPFSLHFSSINKGEYEKFIESRQNSKCNDTLLSRYDSLKCEEYHQLDLADTFMNSFSEEFLFRFLIQKVFFIGIVKLTSIFITDLTTHIPTINPVYRISFSSLLFALSHMWTAHRYLLPIFFSSTVLGYAYEKYGLVGATIIHSVYNLSIYKSKHDFCKKIIETACPQT